jgi:hypothetical protein
MIVERQDVNEYIKECDKYILKLKSHCVGEMFSREYSWRAKHPFKVMSYVNAMIWRIYDMSCAAIALFKQNKIIPALCLVRACWENMVATYELKELILNCCEKKTLDSNADNILMRLLYSNRYDKDNRYMSEEFYEQFKEYRAKNILTLVQKLEKDYPQVKNIYSEMCEFVHPNGDGVCGSYSYLDEANHTVLFGPQFSQESSLFPAFITTLSCSIDLYVMFIVAIKESIVEFSQLCENSLYSK